MLGKLHYHALLAVHLVFCVGFGQDGHQRTFHTKAWFDHVWHKLFGRTFDNIFHTAAADSLNITQIKISPVRNPHQLFTTNWKIKFDINRFLAIVRTVFGRHVELVHVIIRETEFIEKLMCARQ